MKKHIDEDICFKLGKIIRKKRIRAEFSIKQLAIHSTLSKSTIILIESGKGNPLYSTLVKLSKGFKTTLWELVKSL